MPGTINITIIRIAQKQVTTFELIFSHLQHHLDYFILFSISAIAQEQDTTCTFHDNFDEDVEDNLDLDDDKIT